MICVKQEDPFNPTRRRFVAASVASAAALTLPSQVRADDQPPRIPIGFLGATYSHGPDKIKLAMSSPDWEFVGVCDESDAGREICKKLGAKLVSEDELFRHARVVAVESDIRDHGAHALRALRAGKHVHLEKPPAAKLAEVDAIFRLASDQKLLVQTGFMWRYNPGFVKIFEAVKQGHLGDVVLVRGHISNNLAPARRPDWAEFAGGSMFELGSHLIDATVRLLGKPKRVTPISRHHGKFDDALHDNHVVTFEYDHAMAVITNTALQPVAIPARSFEVIGTKGTATLSPIESPTLTIDLAEQSGPYKKGSQVVSLPPYQRYQDDFTELAAAVRGERALSVSLEVEELVATTVLQASGMIDE